MDTVGNLYAVTSRLLKFDGSLDSVVSLVWGEEGNHVALERVVADSSGNVYVAGVADYASGSWSSASGDAESVSGIIEEVMLPTYVPSFVERSMEFTYSSPVGNEDTGSGDGLVEILVLKNFEY